MLNKILNPSIYQCQEISFRWSFYDRNSIVILSCGFSNFAFRKVMKLCRHFHFSAIEVPTAPGAPMSCDVRTYVFKSPFVGLFECEKVAETFVFRRNLWLTNDDKAWMVAVNLSTKAVARGYSGTLFQRGGLITCIVQPYLLVVAISHCR